MKKRWVIDCLLIVSFFSIASFNVVAQSTDKLVIKTIIDDLGTIHHGFWLVLDSTAVVMEPVVGKQISAQYEISEFISPDVFSRMCRDLINMNRKRKKNKI